MKRHQKLIPEETLPGSRERFSQSRAAADVFVGSAISTSGSITSRAPTIRLPSASSKEDCTAISKATRPTKL